MSPAPFTFASQDSLASFRQRYPELDEFIQRFNPEWTSVAADAAADQQSWEGFWRQQQQDPDILLGECARAFPETHGEDHGDWTEATLDELVNNLLDTHHVFVRVQLGRMAALLQVLIKGAPRPSERLDRVQANFSFLRTRWLSHMEMEERDFFPACLRLETTRDFIERAELDRLITALRQTSHDHREIDRFADRLQQAIDAARDDVTPEQYPFLRELENSLAAFVDDSLQHTSKEDDILLPAVMFTHEIRRSDSESGRIQVPRDSEQGQV